MKRLRVLGIFLLVLMFAAGCGSKESSPPAEQTQNGQTDTSDVTEESEGSEDTDSQKDIQSEEPEEPSDPDTADDAETEEEWTAKVYYIDDATGEMTSKDVAVEDEDDIWAQLQESGILTEECELLSFDVDTDGKKIDLDFNGAVGDRIRSMGTTGETEIIGCIVNTYLDSYGCDGIRLTEEGQPLETAQGADLDGYTGRIEL